VIREEERQPQVIETALCGGEAMLFHEDTCPEHNATTDLEQKKDVTAAQELTMAIYILIIKETPTTPWLSKEQMRGNAKTPKTFTLCRFVASRRRGKEKEGVKIRQYHNSLLLVLLLAPDPPRLDRMPLSWTRCQAAWPQVTMGMGG
jgi:hypothetical protein